MAAQALGLGPLVSRLLQAALIDVVVGQAGNAFVKTLAPQPAAQLQQGMSNQKYMPTLGDATALYLQEPGQQAQRALLNYFGANLSPFDPDYIIDKNLNRNRLLAAEAGARELQKAQLAVNQAVYPQAIKTEGEVTQKAYDLLSNTLANVIGNQSQYVASPNAAAAL